jgi:hypothetical protein
MTTVMSRNVRRARLVEARPKNRISASAISSFAKANDVTIAPDANQLNTSQTGEGSDTA